MRTCINPGHGKGDVSDVGVKPDAVPHRQALNSLSCFARATGHNFLMQHPAQPPLEQLDVKLHANVAGKHVMSCQQTIKQAEFSTV